MARLPGYIKVEVEVGPAYRACLDVLDLSRELIELVPEWHTVERKELESRIAGLADQIQASLRSGK